MVRRLVGWLVKGLRRGAAVVAAVREFVRERSVDARLFRKTRISPSSNHTRHPCREVPRSVWGYA